MTRNSLATREKRSVAENPFFQFYPSDWIAGTSILTAVEKGVYITLISMMYERNEPLRISHDRLARNCGCTKGAFKKALDILLESGKIVEVDGGLWNVRVKKEIKKREEKSEVAKLSAKIRWQKSEQNQQMSDANAMRTQCERNANQIPDTRDITSTIVEDGVAVDATSEALWKRGVPFLIERGVPERQARALLGKWIRDNGAQAVFEALAGAKRAGTGDPVPYIAEALKPPPDVRKMVGDAIKKIGGSQ